VPGIQFFLARSVNASGQIAIRRVNVEIAPITGKEFRRLKDAKIGTYVLFQETYHLSAYHKKMHLSDPKAETRSTGFQRFSFGRKRG